VRCRPARLVGYRPLLQLAGQREALPKLGGLEDTQIERLVALKPDLVLVASSARAIDRLEALGLRVVVLEPRTLQDTERVLSRSRGRWVIAAAGPALWQRLQARVAAAAARVPAALRGRKVYFEVASAPYAASEASFVGENLARLGMGNIVPAALGPFPKLNPEFIVRAQPDIVMATASAVAEMPGRPGWAAARAARAPHLRLCAPNPGTPWCAPARAWPRAPNSWPIAWRACPPLHAETGDCPCRLPRPASGPPSAACAAGSA
jgi:iron complex transport system substrate-binding protein